MSAASSPPPVPAGRKLRPSTLPDEVLRELRGALIRGELQPGDRIRADLVADGLGVSVNTVAYHIKQLFLKLDVHDRAGAIGRITTGSGGRGC